MLQTICGVTLLTISGGFAARNLYNAIYRKDFKVNSTKDDIREAFIKFIRRCKNNEGPLEMSFICGKTNCSFPAIFKIILTENEDLDEILNSIKTNNYTNFIRKHLKDQNILDKLDFRSVVDKEVSYTMYPDSNSMTVAFYSQDKPNTFYSSGNPSFKSSKQDKDPNKKQADDTLKEIELI